MSLLQLLTLLPGPHYISCHFFYLCVESVEKTLFSFLWHAGTGFFFFFPPPRKPSDRFVDSGRLAFFKTSDEMRPGADSFKKPSVSRRWFCSWAEKELGRRELHCLSINTVWGLSGESVPARTWQAHHRLGEWTACMCDCCDLHRTAVGEGEGLENHGAK